MKRYYLVVIWGDVEPGIMGPFPTHIERDDRAHDIRMEEGNEHGLFPLDIIADGPIEVELGAYSAGEFYDYEVEDDGTPGQDDDKYVV